MKTTEICGKKVSKMSLGTVQLGMNYGIANNGGQPKLEQSMDMLSTALTNGVCALDTARAYGNSEDVLGQFLASWSGERPFITTKVPPFKSITSEADIEKHIIGNVETSLEKLGISKADCILLHNADNLIFEGDKAAKVMGDLVKRGYADMVGASVYTGDDIDLMMRHEEYTVTQVPMSIFDQRLIADGHIEALEKAGYSVFVRSVFLQGLFFLDPEKITDPILLEHAKPRIEKLREYAEKESMTIAEIAIAFMRDVPGVTSLVLGADTSEQVLSNTAYFNAPSISEETTAAIRKTFADVDIPEIMKVLSRPKK